MRAEPGAVLVIEMDWDTVRRMRVRRHSLVRRSPPSNLTEVVSGVCGIHAQMTSAADLSIAARVDVTAAEIRQALWEQRTLVKAHSIRGTLHILASNELPMWMAAQRARHERSSREETRRFAYLGLAPQQIEELVGAISASLDGRCLTLDELDEQVVRRTGDWAAERRNEAWVSGSPIWRSALGVAARQGLVCFGPSRGARVTLVRPDQWLGGWNEVDPDVALREVFRRFLHAYGPVTPLQFAQWFDLPGAAAKELATGMATELVEVSVEGSVGVMLATDLEQPQHRSGASLRLLPHFDCYLRGFHPRGQMISVYGERSAGGTGQVPVLLVDGKVAGVWTRQRRRGRMVVRVEPFVRLNRVLQRQLETEAQRVGAVTDTPTDFEVGQVAVRAHL